MTSNHSAHQTDFGIIVALPVELNAVLRQWGEYQKHVSPHSDTRTYYAAHLPTQAAEAYDVVATMLPRMGNIEAALAASDLIHLWSPRYVLLIGIAGGLDQSYENFGDVIIGEEIWYYEPAKVVKGASKSTPRVIPADSTLIDRAKSLHDPSWIMRVPDIASRRIPGRLPKVHFGPLASGEKVVADTAFAQTLLGMHRKMAGVEMESGGVASAALSAAKGTGFFAIRGISDFADSQKSDDWHDYAACCAAAWACSFLSSGPIPPMTRPEYTPFYDRPPEEINEVALFNEILPRIDNEDFKTLCFVLGVDADEIPGDRKSSRVRELILRFRRREELEHLAQMWTVFKEAY